jgi:hypothetical protein
MGHEVRPGINLSDLSETARCTTAPDPMAAGVWLSACDWSASSILSLIVIHVFALTSWTPLGPDCRSGHPLFQATQTEVGSASWTLSGLILALIMTSDTQMASELTQEERIQLAITALKDGTIEHLRKAAYIYNVPRSTLQVRFNGRRFVKQARRAVQRLSVQEKDSIKRCIITITAWAGQ